MSYNKVVIDNLPESYEEITVAICGNVDSGKSSLCGVLTHPDLRYNIDTFETLDEKINKEILDDGNGLSRNRVMALGHEQKTGRTSSITYNYMVFDKHEPQPRVISLVDLAGHEQYLKTTITGVVSSYPEHGIVLIAKNVTQMSCEHYSMLVAMGIPVLFVLTKIDIIPDKTHAENLKKIKRMTQRFNKKLVQLNTHSDILDCLDNKHTGVIRISNKTGVGLHLLISYIKHIKQLNNKDKNLVNGFAINTVYKNITGFGMVVSGINGTPIKKGDSMMLGPFGDTSAKDNFIPVKIRSLHNDYRHFVDTLDVGVRGCLCLKFDDKYKSRIRMGMVVVHNTHDINAVKTFEADIAIFRGKSSNIKSGYSTYINIGSVRCAVKITRIRDIETDEDIAMLNTKKAARVDIEFVNRVNCINNGDKFLFRSNRVCGIGKVTKLGKSICN